MKIAAISDTHGRPFHIPMCDVFIHAGDLTAGGTYEESYEQIARIRGMLSFYSNRSNIPVIIVPGNHDKAFEDELPRFKEVLEDYRGMGDIHVLIDQSVVIDGKTFYGSPWTPTYKHWSFMSDEDELERKYRNMPDTLDVLITHGPPHGILDPGFEAKHAGSEALRDAVEHRAVRHHFFGHLHAAGGQTWGRFHNVACVDEAYNIKRGCLEIEI